MIRFQMQSMFPKILLAMLATTIAWFSMAARPVEAQKSSGPEGFTTLEIGASAPDFDLPGVDDRNYRLADFAESEILMVVFTCNHCPTAQAYEERLNKIHDDYTDRGVAVVAISPNDPLAVRLDELGYSDLGDTLADMKIRAKDAGFKFPYLYDGETQKTSLAYGVLATPHVFIFDKQRKLKYKGRIDDSEVKTVTSHDARNALDAMLAGQQVPVAVTRVFGCSTKWSDKRESARKAVEKWDREPVELSLIDEAGLKKIAANETGNYRLVNVWATWCSPCIEELPELVTINRMFRGRDFEMVTISADDAESKDKALELLKKVKSSGRNVLFNSDDRDALFDGLDSEWEGGLPYTVLIAPGGEVVYRKHAEIDPTELKRVIADHVGRTYAPRPKLPAKPRSTIETGANFKTENLVAWCIVPFDAKQRTPAERAAMVRRLGLKRVAYDWREKHVPEFEDEILQYKQQGIEFFAFWSWHDSIEPLIRKHGIRPQIWHYVAGKIEGSPQKKIALVASRLKPMIDKTRELGLQLGIYNHGGWSGDPENMIAVCEHIRKTQDDSDHVGIVYNFHHGHDDIDGFAKNMKHMRPYLLCLNLNGMADPDSVDHKSLANKILPIGTGLHEREMIHAVAESGYTGPIGILDHLNEVDSEVALQENIDGLAALLVGKEKTRE